MQKKVYAMGLAALIILLLLTSICSLVDHYSKQPLKMIYKLKENESVVEVAQRFKVNPQDIKIDDNYLIFEVK